MAFLPFLGAGLGALGSIFGSINSSNSQNEATQAAQQSSAAQNQISQQQLAIYQQLLQQYNQNVQPLQAPLGGEYESLLQSLNPQIVSDNYLNALQNPDQATGYDETDLNKQVLSYLQNPQATNAAATLGVEGQQLISGGQGQSNLGSVAPGAISGLLSGGLTGNASKPGVGASAVDYYLNQAQHGGINPLLINNALGQQSTSNARDINDIRNSMGGTSNIGALLENQNRNNSQSTAGLIAQLTGQSQQLETQAEGSALNAAQSTDAANNAATGQAVGTAGQLDQQNLQYMLAALQSAGGLDSQTMSMLTSAQQLGSNAEQTQLGNLGMANSTSQNLLAQIQNYIAQGQAGATGVASGLQGVGSQYGAAASGAAANAAAAAAAPNPFTGLGSSLINYSAPKNNAVAPTSLLSGGGGSMAAAGKAGADASAPYQMAGDGNLYV